MSTASQLPDDVDALKRLVIERQTQIDEHVQRHRQAQDQVDALLNQVESLQSEAHNNAVLIEKLKLHIAILNRARFGASSEKLDGQIEQLELILDELESSQARVDEPASKQAEVNEPQKPVSVGKALPARLVREVIVHDSACGCPHCGAAELRLIGTDRSEQLDYVPERFKVIVHERPKYACTQCNALVQASAPSRPIAKSVAGAGLLAHVLISKYADHLPLYRQSEMMAREGIEISRSTLADWVGASSALLDPLVQALRQHVFGAEKLHTDDTPVPVLQPGRGTTKIGRLWAYVRDGRNHAEASPAAVWFGYSADRKAEHPQRHLKEFRGHLQADAYAGYEPLYRSGQIVEVACWAHARRKFFDIHAATGSPIAQQALQRIARLYEIESRIRGQQTDQRKQMRQAHAAPLLEELEHWLHAQLALLSKKSELTKAIHYCLGRWRALSCYVDDGRLEIDNNIAENAIRPIALGEKNYLFAGSDAGGQRAANLYSLLGTAKMHGINPRAYLSYVLANIADTKISRLAELLPWNVADKINPVLATQRRADAYECVVDHFLADCSPRRSGVRTGET